MGDQTVVHQMLDDETVLRIDDPPENHVRCSRYCAGLSMTSLPKGVSLNFIPTARSRSRATITGISTNSTYAVGEGD
jgi:hypothetical protein